MNKDKSKTNDVDGVQTYRDRWKSESKPKDQKKSDPEFAPRGNRIPTLERHSVDPNKDTVYRVGEYAPRGFYSQSQLNNNMSGTDANAIYQATHDQRMRNTWSDPNPALVDQANVILNQMYGPTIEAKPASISDEFADYLFSGELAPVTEKPSAPGTLPDMLYTYDTPGGQAFNTMLRNNGYKVNTGRQYYKPDGSEGAYVAGADALTFPESDLRLYEGYGTGQGIPEVLLDMNAMSNVYSRLLQNYIDRNPANYLWY